MKNTSFDLAMSKIANEAEAERLNEIRAEERRRKMGKVRGIVAFLAIATAGVMGLCYHAELQDAIYSKLQATPRSAGIEAGTSATTEGKAASTLDKAQANAATRDNLIDSLAK